MCFFLLKWDLECVFSIFCPLQYSMCNLILKSSETYTVLGHFTISFHLTFLPVMFYGLIVQQTLQKYYKFEVFSVFST